MKNCRLISGEGSNKEHAKIAATVQDRIAGDEPARLTSQQKENLKRLDAECRALERKGDTARARFHLAL